MEVAAWSIGAAIVIALVLRVFPWMVKHAVREVVNETLDPLAARLDEHMRLEEAERIIIHNALADIKAQFVRNEVEHSAMHGRIKRLEK